MDYPKQCLGVLIILLSAVLTASAQLILQYQSCNNCLTSQASYNLTQNFGCSHISSDFGPRNLGYYDWHGGIDYSVVPGDGDLGYHLISPVNGVVAKIIYEQNSSYKAIVINGPGENDLGFGHIFLNGMPPNRCGDLVFLKNPATQAYCILNLTSGIAIEPGGSGTITYEGLSYPVQSTVTAGQVIAPLGNSGATNAHLHVFRPCDLQAPFFTDNNVSNPLEFVSHCEPQYNLSLHVVNRLTFSPQGIWYGGGTPASLGIRCTMLNANGAVYPQSTMNIDKMMLMIRKENDVANPFLPIEGSRFQSLISLGGTTNTVRYPSLHNPTGNTYDIVNQKGSLVNQGVDPFAYNTSPFDDYYFTGILTRIHTLNVPGQIPGWLAMVPEDARYPDGVYELRVRATSITGQVYEMSPGKIYLDNFYPILRRVIIRKGSANGPVVYDARWQWNGNALTWQNPVSSGATPYDELFVSLTTSEDLTQMSGTFGNFSFQLYSSGLGFNGPQQWSFTVPPNTLGIGVNGLSVTGTDLAGNPLLGITSTQAIPVSSIPYRLDGTWSVAPITGPDKVHKFNILPLTPPIAAFSPSQVQINPGNLLNFSNQSSGSINACLWTFAGGQPAVSAAWSPQVEYPSVGLYPVALQVSNAAGTSTANGMVEVTAGCVPPIAAFSPANFTLSVGETLTFADLSTGNPASWSWDFEGAAPPSLMQHPQVSFNTVGFYSISLTVSNACGTNIATAWVWVSPESGPLEVSCFINPFIVSVGQQCVLEAHVFNGSGPYQYVFDFGNGFVCSKNTLSGSESCVYTYPVSGNYQLKVTVTDNSWNTAVCDQVIYVEGGDPCASLNVEFASSFVNNSVPVNQVITCSKLISGGSPPYFITWVFHPDPLTGAQASISYYLGPGPVNVSYPLPGNYPVHLHVSDLTGCVKTYIGSITVYDPQHCVIARIGKGNHPLFRLRKGTNYFYDFSWVPWCVACEEPAGSGNYPCITDSRWTLRKMPSMNQLTVSNLHPNVEPGCSPAAVNQHVFSWNFTQAGKYMMSLRTWDGLCQLAPPYDCQDETHVLVEVVDCESVLELCSGNIQGTQPDLFEGTITIGGYGCSYNIQAGAAVNILATQEIRILSEFSAAAGSEMQLRISDCPDLLPFNVLMLAGAVDESNAESHETDEPRPNPSEGIFRIESDRDAYSKYEIINLLGQLIQRVEIPARSPLIIDLTAYPPGVYLCRLYSAGRIRLVRLVRR